MSDFYSNAEDDDEDDIDQHAAVRSSSHALQIELCILLILFFRKIAAHVFSVPASSAAVEREFNFTGNIITQKGSKLAPDVVNDMIFNHSYKLYQQGLDDTDNFALH
ncbi:unnamed protein product [Rotaria sp. Silwood2]|nr:unnamed protein product [Rotaria sp. Silwood2]CAF2892654.1 unnamed protein product [Rotaria sp. Silwood2]CAF3297504.1 unnamed protein product [Rotaria sp. Silwood2]CAF4334139.1 unnamed protein product [Rotaria sp. Silwood2]CAF4586185.1 unnamed protein product [Rotaria sp. Silwood2]